MQYNMFLSSFHMLKLPFTLCKACGEVEMDNPKGNMLFNFCHYGSNAEQSEK